MKIILGPTGAIGELPLITKSDYRYQFEFRNEDGTPKDFPEGSELYYLVGAEEDRWDFVTEGSLAAIHTESTRADLIKDESPFWLLFVNGQENDVLFYGNVKRYEP